MIVSKNSSPSPSNPMYPTYIFRGHEEQIMNLEFDENNSYILSGDSGGTIIIWDLITKRPIIKFQGHTKGILRVTLFHNKLISHGRDNFIHIWKLDQYLKHLKINELKPFCEESKLNPENSLFINSSSFCKFDLYCKEGIEQEEILVAIPSIKESSGIDIWNLSNKELIVSSIGLDDKRERGYCMALKLFQISQPNNYLILASYENGSVVLWSITINQIDTSSKDDNKRIVVDQLWNCKEHVESVLALDISANKKFAISTAGDNKIVKYIFDENYQNKPSIKSTIIKHSGIADVKIRSDGKIFATAGWDAKIRVFSSKTLKPLAILSYHRDSIYSLAFSRIFEQDSINQLEKSDNNNENVSLIDNNNNNNKIVNSVDEVIKHYLVGGSKDHRISLWEIY
ncbi:hypothetical protein Glove_103g71 [Diversispora epigaea]|uniref:ASTRA-associated protein 1 n=1 Tax=Diversispora epigaea TaxID=1348612 RepID=A0A397J485_9GLOM|nr:hypothetical protein Glove_103g71 [Diversispora epigaea]